MVKRSIFYEDQDTTRQKKFNVSVLCLYYLLLLLLLIEQIWTF